MSPKNCMVAQSGGPTVAINASLAGVIDGVMRSDCATIQFFGLIRKLLCV